MPLFSSLRQTTKRRQCEESRRTDNYWRSGPTENVSVLSSAEVVFLHVIAERAEAHTQELGGLHLHAPGALERLREVAALDLFDVRFEVHPAFGQRLDGSGRHFRAVAADGG